METGLHFVLPLPPLQVIICSSIVFPTAAEKKLTQIHTHTDILHARSKRNVLYDTFAVPFFHKSAVVSSICIMFYCFPSLSFSGVRFWSVRFHFPQMYSKWKYIVPETSSRKKIVHHQRKCKLQARTYIFYGYICSNMWSKKPIDTFVLYGLSS